MYLFVINMSEGSFITFKYSVHENALDVNSVSNTNNYTEFMNKSKETPLLDRIPYQLKRITPRLYEDSLRYLARLDMSIP